MSEEKINSTDLANGTANGASTEPEAPPPPQEWVCDSMGYNSCIKFEPVPKSWYESKASCIYQGGELVRIYDRAYLEWVDQVRDEVQLSVSGSLRKKLDNFWTFYNDVSNERFTN